MKDDLSARLRHLRETHPDLIQGLLHGRLSQASKHENWALVVLGSALGTLAVDVTNPWSDEEILAACIDILTHVRAASANPQVVAKMQDLAATVRAGD